MVGEVGRSEDIIVGHCGTMYADGRLIGITVSTIGYMIVGGMTRRILMGYIGHYGTERSIQLVGGVCASKSESLPSAPLMRNSIFGDCLVLFKDRIPCSFSSPDVIGNAPPLVEKPISG